jgi:hypothetical protein
LLLPVGRDRHSPGTKQKKAEQLLSPKLVFREAGTQASPVTMSRPSPRASAPPLLPLFIKGPLKVGGFLLWGGALLWALGLFAWLLAFFALEGFLPLNIGKKLLLWAF